MIFTKNDFLSGQIIINPYDKDQKLQVLYPDGDDWLWCHTLPDDPEPSKWKIEISLIKRIVRNEYYTTY